MYTWSIKKLKLDLKFTWKISRGSSTQKTLFHIKVSDGKYSGTGEVAGITAGESHDQYILDQFNEYYSLNPTEYSKDTAQNLPAPLRFGIESAWTHLQANKSGTTVAEYLNTKPCEDFRTSFSVPILPTAEIGDFVREYDLARFSSLKIKVGHENKIEPCLELSKHYKGPIRVDANEAFSTATEVVDFYHKLAHLPIEFIEQPIASSMQNEYKQLKSKLPCPIIADESLQDGDVSPEFIEMFDGINVKLMKAGGYQQAINQLNQAKQLGMKTMIGCMVESSLGISSALNIAEGVDYIDLDGFLFFKEDPFDFVSERNGVLKKNTNF